MAMSRSRRDPHHTRVMERVGDAPTPPLPGKCAGCGARVYLRGMVWCDEDDTKHECAS